MSSGRTRHRARDRYGATHRNEFETSLNGYLLRAFLSASCPCSGVRTILSQRTTELGVCTRIQAFQIQYQLQLGESDA